MPENANSPQRLRSEKGKRPRLFGPSTARGRFRVILPLLRFRSRQAVGETSRVTLPSGTEIFEFTELAKYCARQAHVSSRTVFRWLKRFDDAGYAALVDPPRKDRGISRFFSKHPLVAAFVITRYLEGWSVVAIHEALRQAWALLCRDGSPFPCFDTVRAFIKKMIPAHLAKKPGNARSSLPSSASKQVQR